ncbi:hypothetical protein J6590_037730 [Homalodisca vitripennis]|nr:hypothetical protein J6590_094236 [Homalodisca vitripennis]KAG8282361.1 hypothetical protein J6590_037730 [Homalodisca vitripennis]
MTSRAPRCKKNQQKTVRISVIEFMDCIRNMLECDSDSEGEVVDDSDAYPDFVLPNDRPDSESEESSLEIEDNLAPVLGERQPNVSNAVVIEPQQVVESPQNLPDAEENNPN